MPVLAINTANEARKGAAATESFRNEMSRQSTQTQRVLLTIGNIKQPGAHGDAAPPLLLE
jgi:hypothetical protein